MANSDLFKAARAQAPAATTVNKAGGLAYSLTPEQALAQLACTGTFADTFYGKAVDQLEAVRRTAELVTPEFLAKLAVYARTKGYMKDMPAALAVILSKKDPVLLDKIFDRVIDNGKQVRNFVQMIRSGAFGRKSLGSGPKRLVRRYLKNRSDYRLFRDSVGNSPSLADIIKMVRPQSDSKSRVALYGYLIGCKAAKPGQALVENYVNGKGKECKRYLYDAEALPEIVKQFEAFKKGDRTVGVPNVDFRQLTALPLTVEDWKQIALRGKWHQTRMNLNTYERQGVLKDDKVVQVLAERLADKDEILSARAFPYQLLAAYLFTDNGLDQRLRNALQEAMEIATDNVPTYKGNVYVIVDTSGSMSWGSVTGNRPGATSKVRPIDVAALVGATVLRKNKNAIILPVDTRVHANHDLNPHDSIMTNATKLAKFGGGGTDLGAAMKYIEGQKTPDVIICVSDNESWVDSIGRPHYRGTQTMESFVRLQRKNPDIKMVCIDTQAATTVQAATNKSILNCGGFDDSLWLTIQRFVEGDDPDAWVSEIKTISLD